MSWFRLVSLVPVEAVLDRSADVQGHEAAADGLQHPPLAELCGAPLCQPLVLEEAQQ
mgnify:CR=1 FL=1